MAAVLDIGEQQIRDVVRQALGDTRYNRLVVEKKSTRTTKQENHAMVRGIYPFLPGANRAEKEQYLIDLGRKVFTDDKRFIAVLEYVKSRVSEHEDAGGTIEDFPPPPAPFKPALTGKEAGFLWKPVAEHGPNLVVLLPSAFTHRTSKRADLLVNGKVIESSRRAHNDAEQPNGNREHYRFSKPGRAYPSGVQLRITAEGHTYTWTIPNPANRYSGHAIKAKE